MLYRTKINRRLNRIRFKQELVIGFKLLVYNVKSAFHNDNYVPSLIINDIHTKLRNNETFKLSMKKKDGYIDLLSYMDVDYLSSRDLHDTMSFIVGHIERKFEKYSDVHSYYEHDGIKDNIYFTIRLN